MQKEATVMLKAIEGETLITIPKVLNIKVSKAVLVTPNSKALNTGKN